MYNIKYKSTFFCSFRNQYWASGILGGILSLYKHFELHPLWNIYIQKKILNHTKKYKNNKILNKKIFSPQQTIVLFFLSTLTWFHSTTVIASTQLWTGPKTWKKAGKMIWRWNSENRANGDNFEKITLVNWPRKRSEKFIQQTHTDVINSPSEFPNCLLKMARNSVNEPSTEF